MAAGCEKANTKKWRPPKIPIRACYCIWQWQNHLKKSNGACQMKTMMRVMKVMYPFRDYSFTWGGTNQKRVIIIQVYELFICDSLSNWVSRTCKLFQVINCSENLSNKGFAFEQKCTWWVCWISQKSWKMQSHLWRSGVTTCFLCDHKLKFITV